jgi:kinesin family protein 18/19
MIGNENSGAGVMVLTMRDLFKEVDARKTESKIKISISYLEVYNETIRDLFIENSPPLMLCEDQEQNANVSGKIIFNMLF